MGIALAQPGEQVRLSSVKRAMQCGTMATRSGKEATVRDVVTAWFHASGPSPLASLGYYAWTANGLRPTKAASGEALLANARFLEPAFLFSSCAEIHFSPLRDALQEKMLLSLACWRKCEWTPTFWRRK